jgi:hypothetical protein
MKASSEDVQFENVLGIQVLSNHKTQVGRKIITGVEQKKYNAQVLWTQIGREME